MLDLKLLFAAASHCVEGDMVSGYAFHEILAMSSAGFSHSATMSLKVWRSFQAWLTQTKEGTNVSEEVQPNLPYCGCWHSGEDQVWRNPGVCALFLCLLNSYDTNTTQNYSTTNNTKRSLSLSLT